MKFSVSRLACFLFATLIVLTLPCVSHAQKWRLIVAGDGRSDPRAQPPRPEDKVGINTLITAEMRDAVLREKAKVLLWTGDLVYGSNDMPELRKMLLAWREIMDPLYDAGVQVLPVRGNHENRGPEAVGVWNEVFSGRYALPHNGPSNAKNLSFYAIRDGVLMVGVDEYANGPGTLPVTWLSGILSKRRTNHVFVYGHEMAFMAGNHKDCLDRFPENRDAFWKLYARAGGRAFFAGHDHFYDHMSVRAGNGNGFPEIHQYVAGTAGAPFYKDQGYSGNNAGWEIKRVLHLDNTFGYIVVDIDGRKATITFKGRVAPGKYVPMDTWSYVAEPLKH